MIKWTSCGSLLVFMAILGGWISPGVVMGAAPGKFAVVSTGPGDPQHMTLKAVETIKAADLVLCEGQTAKRLAKYLEGKKTEDPWENLWTHQGKIWMKDLGSFPAAERAGIVAQKKAERDEFVKRMQGLLAQGKQVVLLDGGDPTIYSRAYWLLEGLPQEQVEIVPGVGALTASMAALKRASSGAGARYVAQTAPFGFFGKKDPEDLARDLGRHPGTLVFYMGLSEMGKIVETLKKHNPADLPIAVVYYAGYEGKERAVQGTLNDIMAKLAPEQEKWMGMIIVGRCLTGPSFVLGE